VKFDVTNFQVKFVPVDENAITKLLSPFVGNFSVDKSIKKLNRTESPNFKTYHILASMGDLVYVRIPELLVSGFGFKTPTMLYVTRTGKLERIDNVDELKVQEFIEFCQKEVEL
jgi:hypothetical protein